MKQGPKTSAAATLFSDKQDPNDSIEPSERVFKNRYQQWSQASGNSCEPNETRAQPFQ